MTGQPARPRPNHAWRGVEIKAAGAVLYRPAGQGIEVALIHRPRREDWTFPKGKLEPGEHVLMAAVREVTEETGIRPVLGRPLATVRYQVDGGPKRVDYWAAGVDHVPDAPFFPGDEVDRLEWLSPAAARSRLSYAHEGRMLERLLAPAGGSGPPDGDTVPCILLRHASAGRKSAWHGDDLLRPLDERGAADAALLADLIGCFGVQRVISSAAERCLGTVRPYAERIGTAIETEPAFTVTAAGSGDRDDAARQRMTGLLAQSSPMVICGHRENIPVLLAQASAVLPGFPPGDSVENAQGRLLGPAHRAGAAGGPGAPHDQQLDDMHRAVAEVAGRVLETSPAQTRVTLDRAGISHGGACARSELEEVPMSIVGGLDIHRKQLTFDYLDTVTGEVKRGQIAPADREHLRAWLARFAGRADVAFAVEGCTGWRYVAGELAAAGLAAHVGELEPYTAAARGRKRHAKTDKTDSGTCTGC